jgi:NADPH:quinone reductase-like Zn-dependent oxidoreductase
VIQLARISGLSPIITTASLTNADYLKSLGATHVFDRNVSTTELRSQISTITQAPLKYIFDAISLPATQTLGLSLLADGGQLAIVLPLEVKLPEGREARHVVGILRLPHQIAFTETLYHDTITPLLEKGLFKACVFCFKIVSSPAAMF